MARAEAFMIGVGEGCFLFDAKCVGPWDREASADFSRFAGG